MKKIFLITLAVFLCLLLIACNETKVDVKAHPISNREIAGIKISSLPETCKYDLSGEDAEKIYNYLTNLELEYYSVNNDLNGLTYVIIVEYDNGVTKTLYYSSYLLGTSDGWYKIINYKEQEFEKILEKF